jgi:hypothetical protein
MLVSVCTLVVFGLVISMLMSSTNRIGVALLRISLGKSLMQMRNNTWSKIDPCGMLAFTSAHLENVV